MSAWTTVPTLVGAHVTLRPLRADDGDALALAATDGNQTRLFYAIVASVRDPDAFVARALGDHDVGRAMPFAVEAPDGRVVGTTRLMRMSEPNRRVEIGGTFYARSVQRTGVNTEAKLLLLTHAFDVLGCTCVQIRTDWLNKRSQAAIERLGAKRDGVLRNHQRMADGRIRDTVVYSIIAGEWPGVRQNLGYLLDRHEEPS